MTSTDLRELDARRAAAKRTAWIVAGVVFAIYGMFWLSGILGA
ncbi:MAG TPA: hypothetical protein VN581_03355 [Patescibacteria group bacterium]|nr:hypothetical protein [Patescibacteria group bacterium]